MKLNKEDIKIVFNTKSTCGVFIKDKFVVLIRLSSDYEHENMEDFIYEGEKYCLTFIPKRDGEYNFVSPGIHIGTFCDIGSERFMQEFIEIENIEIIPE